jgi:hypothetical protein
MNCIMWRSCARVISEADISCAEKGSKKGKKDKKSKKSFFVFFALFAFFVSLL